MVKRIIGWFRPLVVVGSFLIFFSYLYDLLSPPHIDPLADILVVGGTILFFLLIQVGKLKNLH